MSPVDSLLLDAKQAIFDEQHKRFQKLHHEGRWCEAMQQFRATLHCATDLLSDSLNILEQLLDAQRHREPQPPSSGTSLTV